MNDFGEVDYDEIEFVNDSDLSKLRDEYAEYIMSRIRGSFNFKDWYSHTYSKNINDETVKDVLFDLIDVVQDEAYDTVYDMNQPVQP